MVYGILNSVIFCPIKCTIILKRRLTERTIRDLKSVNLDLGVGRNLTTTTNDSYETNLKWQV